MGRRGSAQRPAQPQNSRGCIPVFDGATFAATYQTNTDCDEIILEDVTLDGYNAYIAKLEASGFKKYTNSDFSGNLFTTLYNEKYTPPAITE